MYMYKHLLSALHKSFNELVIDAFLDKDPAGGQTYLPLVGKGRPNHCWQALVQISIIEDNTGVFSTQLK